MSSFLPAHRGDSVCVTQVELPPPATLFLVSTSARKMESEGIMDVGPEHGLEVLYLVRWPRNCGSQPRTIFQSCAPWHTEMQGRHGQVAFLVECCCDKSWGYDSRLFSLGQWPLSSG